jgi:hypothetical protein
MKNNEEGIVNRVATSNLVTFNLEDYAPQGKRVLFDIKDQLFQGLILKEKDFRSFLREHNWEEYQDQYVALTCTADAIIPTWAYMLLGVKLKPFAKKVIFGDLHTLEEVIVNEALEQIDFSEFNDKKVVVKGCSDLSIPQQAYLKVSESLFPYASSIMFGEPCSTVPIYKKAKQ